MAEKKAQRDAYGEVLVELGAGSTFVVAQRNDCSSGGDLRHAADKIDLAALVGLVLGFGVCHLGLIGAGIGDALFAFAENKVTSLATHTSNKADCFCHFDLFLGFILRPFSPGVGLPLPWWPLITSECLALVWRWCYPSRVSMPAHEAPRAPRMRATAYLMISHAILSHFFQSIIV